MSSPPKYPNLRTDIAGLACGAGFVYCLLSGPAEVAPVAGVLGVGCALAPRIRGRVKAKVAGAELEVEEVLTPDEVSEQQRPEAQRSQSRSEPRLPPPD